MANIFVLAGVNGAGKSSIGQHVFQVKGAEVYNPDSVAAQLRSLHPNISHALANGHAWTIGRDLLREAIDSGSDYRLETTLGGNTIPRLLREAAHRGHKIHAWFCGLRSPELHLLRIKQHVTEGGHDIPEKKIRERWDSSRKNLIKLLPTLTQLRVYDNSVEASLRTGEPPKPRLNLDLRKGKVVGPADLIQTPGWAQPILAAALELQES